MFYCDPCRVENNWPRAMAGSYGRCEICGNERSCYDRPASTLPLPETKTDEKLVPYTSSPLPDAYDPSWPKVGSVHPPEPYLEPARAKDRVDDFLALFTEEEKASWRGKDSKAPTWVVLGVSYFLGEDPARKELFRRLKESGD